MKRRENAAITAARTWKNSSWMGGAAAFLWMVISLETSVTNGFELGIELALISEEESNTYLLDMT